MKTIKYFLTAIIALLVLNACSNDDEAYTSKKENNKKYQYEDLLKEGVTLKERDPNFPLILSKRRVHNPPSYLRTLSLSDETPFYKYLGKSLRIKELPLTDYRNFGWSVLDIDKYIKDFPNCYDNFPIGVTESKAFAYSNFNRYVENSKITKKISSGFSLNLVFFSIGAKNNMEKTFSKSMINESNRVFGELHYQYEDSRYRLKKTTNDIKNMKSYLSKSFIDDLCNIPTSELIETYGRVVLCDFIVGGKATALYSGLYTHNQDSETKEKDMGIDINASYGKKDEKNPKDNKNGSINFGFGRGYGTGKERSNKITDLKVTVKTIGGIGAIANYTNPENVNSLNINLSNWLSSLNNKNNHRIIDISDGGLLPITEFIRETNLKYYVEQYINHSSNLNFIEPYLIYLHSEKLNWELLSLRTRYNEGVCLYSEKYINEEHTKNILNQYSSLYKIQLIDFSIPLKKKINNIDPISDNKSGEKHRYFKYILEKLSFIYDSHPKINKIVGSDFKKYTYNNTIYLVCQKKGQNFMYSIHDDYMLDTYGIREWVNQMEEANINPQQLDNYTIIAL